MTYSVLNARIISTSLGTGKLYGVALHQHALLNTRFERTSRIGGKRSPWAVKRVSKNAVSESLCQTRLAAEAEILRRLKHPNVIGFRAYVPGKDGRLCLAMEECENSLDDLIKARFLKRYGPYPAEQILRVAVDISKALDYLHTEARIMHGDVKSHNVLIKGDFEIAKLCNFGVYISVDADGMMDEEDPSDKIVDVISHYWIAPELVDDDDLIVSTKADIFAYGLTLWEMLSLSVPHTEDMDFDVSFDIESFPAKIGTRPSLPTYPLDDAHDPVVHIFNWCTEADLDERPSAKQVVDYLEGEKNVFERTSRIGGKRSPWAVKRVSKNAVSESLCQTRLAAEAEILRRLKHPNVIGFRAYVPGKDGRLCLAMEECENSLDDLIKARFLKRYGPYPAEQILRVAVDISKALDYLHTEARIMHGDVKSHNVLIKGDFEIAKLCNFGVYISVDADGMMDEEDPSDKIVDVISHYWIAPELVDDDDLIVSTKADIFAYGLTLWEMLSLSVPHTEDMDFDVSFDIESFPAKIGTRPSLPTYPLDDAHDPVVHIFNWCTEADLDERPSAKQVVDYLEGEKNVFERTSRIGGKRSPWAVKRVSKNAVSESLCQTRLAAEAEILRRLKHPNVIGFRAYVPGKDGRLCLAMEECENSLDDLIKARFLKRYGPYPAEQILRVAVDISKALDYLHTEARIMHGDVKSHNVLIKGDFEIAKLCNFGVYISVDADGMMDEEDPSDKIVDVISHYWIAPELVDDDDLIVSTKADIFAYGLTLWEMLSLSVPHTEDMDFDVSFDIESFPAKIGTRPSLPTYPLDDAHDPVVHIFNWCTEADLDERPSAKQVVDYLEGEKNVFERTSRIGGKRSPWAVKRVSKNAVSESLCQTRLAAEAEILRRLKHPNVIGFRAYVPGKDGRLCLAMEECENSLDNLIKARFLKRYGPYPAEQILRVAVDISKALDYLHTEARIMHGDVKSHNVLIKGDFEIAKLCNFGVYISVDADGMMDEEDPSDKIVDVISHYWIAPELVDDDDLIVSTKADIFAYGLTLWEMLSLSVPHTEDMDFDVSFDIESFPAKIGTRPSLPTYPLDDAHDPVVHIFNWCTEADLDERPSAKQVVDYLEGEKNVKPVKIEA